MAITTLDGALAGMQVPQAFAKQNQTAVLAGRPSSLFHVGGFPSNAPVPANTAGGVVMTSTGGLAAGQIPHYNPGSGNSYLASFSATASQGGMLLLCDMLLVAAGTSGGTAIAVTTTTAQTMNTSALPARDRTGTINGEGVYWALDVIAATGAGVATPSISYTNSAGTAGQTATLIDTYSAAAALGSFMRFNVASGDLGIKSVQSLTLGVSMTSGTIALTAFRVLAALPVVPLGAASLDALTSGFPRIYDGSVPFLLWIPANSVPGAVSGIYCETQG